MICKLDPCRSRYLVEQLEGRQLLSDSGEPVLPPLGSGVTFMTSGMRYEGSIEAGEIDYFSIDCVANGTLVVSAANYTHPNISMRLRIEENDGTVVANYTSQNGMFPVVHTTTLQPYIITVRATNATAVFDYALTAVVSPAEPVTDNDGGPIISGEFRAGAVEYSDIDAYSIEGTSGGSLFVNLKRTNAGYGSFHLLITAPSGQELYYYQPSSIYDDELTPILLDHLPESGAYGITMFGANGNSSTASVTYSMTAVSAPSTQHVVDSDSAELSSDQHRRGDLEIGDVDVYTIEAMENDALFFILSESEYLGSADVGEPSYIIFSPSGKVLKHETSEMGNVTSYLRLEETGTYTIAVYDERGDDHLVYGLTAALKGKFAGSGDREELTGGVTERHHLGYGEVDVYWLSSGWVTLTDLNHDDFHPQLVAVYPYGELHSSNSDDDGVTIFLPIDLGAVYVFDANGSSRGDYAITQTGPGPFQTFTGDSGPLLDGMPRNGTIEAGDGDTFTFDATAGVDFDINFSKTDPGQSDPRLLIFRPPYYLLHDVTISTSQSIHVSPTETGTFYILVSDNNADRTGTYSIAINAPTQSDTTAPTFVFGDYRYNAVWPDIVIDANEPLSSSFNLDDISLTNLTTGAIISNEALSFAYATSTNRATITPDLILPDGNYRLTVHPQSVSDRSGNALASPFTFEFFVLAGDLNRDRIVNFNDLLPLVQSYGKMGQSFAEGNVSYSSSGEVDFADLLTTSQNYGDSLPMLRSGIVKASPHFTKSRRPIGEQLEMYS